jgi:hypothetical protein
MNRLTKRYNEKLGMYEYVDAFTGAGIFDSIFKGITSKFVKDTAKTLGTKALEAGVNKVGTEVGTRAANKVISKVFKPTVVEPTIIKHIIEEPLKVTKPLIEELVTKPLGNDIIKELNKKSSTDNLNNALKKQYYGYGTAKSRLIPSGDKNFQNKLNRLLN